MNPGLKILLVALLLLALALAIDLAMAGGGDPGLAPRAPEPPRSAESVAAPPPVDRRTDVPIAAEPRRRTEVTDLTPSGDDCAQGIRGRVVDAGGTPLGGIEVSLVEGQGTDLFTTMLMQQRGVVTPPVARTASDRSGAFAVGLQKVLPDKKYELRFVSEQFADHALPNLTIFSDKWVDVGDVELERGVTVHGQVTVQGTGGLPVPEATVSVEVVSSFPSTSPTPGREDGITTTTDHGGFFHLSNVGAGMVTVAAVAPGHAKVERADVQVAAETDNQIDFELPPGMSIAGVVIDGADNPVENAKVRAIAISAKSPSTGDARTDELGRFEVLGLIEGPYQLKAAAQGFVDKPVEPVFAGEPDARIVLERQGCVRLRVVSKAGRLLTRYDASLKRYFQEQDDYSNVMPLPDQRVFPSDLRDGFYRVTGIDPGQFAFEIQADGYAKTYSAPFTVEAGGDEREVVVAMDQGGAIRGTITGHDGRALRRATVTTLASSQDPRTTLVIDVHDPFTMMAAMMIPVEITRASATTDSHGRYLLELLAPGEYQLKFTHPQYYDLYRKGDVVEEARVTDVPPLRMDRPKPMHERTTEPREHPR